MKKSDKNKIGAEGYTLGKRTNSNDCSHPEHKPPVHILLKPGEYEYECPSCGYVTRFTVPKIVYH